MYAVEADNVADTVALVKWVDGTRTVLGSGSFPGFISGISAGTVWIGADFSQYEADGGRINVYASFNEGNLIQAGNLRISIQDTSITPGGTVGLLSNQANVRFVNFTAGSPAHAEFADVAGGAYVLLAGETRRLHYNQDANRFEYTDDGATLTPVAPITSANRPGVTKLYRNDHDSGYNVQTLFDGSRWLLQGYNGDTYHAPARVAYADDANTVDGKHEWQLRGRGTYIFTNIAQSVPFNTYTTLNFAGGNYYWNESGGWDGATALYAQETGWFHVFCQVTLLGPAPSKSDALLRILVNGGYIYGGEAWLDPGSNGMTIRVSQPIYLSAGQYVQFQVFQLWQNPGSTNPSSSSRYTVASLVRI
jgi:hypothetical protein